MTEGRADQARISVRRVTQRYKTARGDFEALTDISFDIGEGEFVSLLGPSGCGKSTLLRIVGGLTPATGGEVLVRGAAVTKPPESLGLVFQTDLLMPWRTVLENIMLQAEIRGLDRAATLARARELLALVGLAAVADSFPSELSGGMRQRVSLCRALVHEPDLLLMDEPFGALDAITRDQMCIELQRVWLAKRKTVLFVTHSIDEAVFLSDRVVVMTPGPGKVALDLAIDLPRPRRIAVRETPGFQNYARQLRETFERFGLLREEA
jgi:NitT/TauT family transport system ATP-binding protein